MTLTELGAILDRRIWTSRAVMAFVGFVVVDLASKFACPADLLERYEPREKTLLADLVRAWKSAPQAPGICFLGSSLMQCALKNSSATFLNDALPKGETSPASFSWALGGENASDSYMIAQSLMSGQKKPKLLIYGIAPRDLLDNNVKSPVTTDIFRYLSTFSAVSSLPSAVFTSLDDRVNCVLKEVSFFVDRKGALTKYATEQMQAVIPLLVPAVRNAKPAPPSDQDKIAQAHAVLTAPAVTAPAVTASDGAAPTSNPAKTSDFTPEALTHVKPTDSMAKKIAAYELLQQVSKGVTIFRYNPYCADRYNRQVVFLDMLLSHLENIGVQVVVVKMPLKNEHVAIMPKELLDSYTRDVERLTTKYGAALLDFNTAEFKDTDYGDVAHLNPNGAKIFQAKLVQTFKASPYREKLASVSAQPTH
ncbi:MAG: hypothetical protein JST89_18790 [Cyanobacteria bacterium SZAS-4]|nr:hypothetical protein [Cyanobacteria bacterium SZAS-4]